MRSTLPALHEFLVVDLDPGFDEAALPAGQVTFQPFAFRQAKDGHVLSVISVQVRRVVLLRIKVKHANDDAEKAANLWHGGVACLRVLVGLKQ